MRDGVWDRQLHQRFSTQDFNTGLVKYILEALAPTTILEFGSGVGHMAKFLNDADVVECVHCIEPPSDVVGLYDKASGPILYPIDIFTDRIPPDLHEAYDLVLSIEVAEHIERNLHDALFDFLTSKAARWVVFSGARPGQPGHGHVACREELDWRGEFLRRGFVFRSDLTEAIRVSCNERNKNHKRNVQILEKP